MAKIVNAIFAKLFTPRTFWYANVAFIMSAPYLLLSFYIFAIHLHGANLCKSVFSSSESCQTVNPVIKAPRGSFFHFLP